MAGTALPGTPNYSLADAGRYLRMPPSTVRAWAKGTVVTKPRARVHFKQVLDGPSCVALTFVDLAELLIIRELRERFNVTLQAIRSAKAYTAREYGKPWYLFDLHVWGREIFVRQFAPTPVSISRSGPLALADFTDHPLQRVQVDDVESIEDIALDHDLAPTQVRDAISFQVAV